MAVRTKIDPIATTIKLFVSKTLSPAAQSQAVADYAAGAIADADATNVRVLGRLPPRTITVDGVEGAPLNSVNPSGGEIITEWELVTDVLVWIGETLKARSPIVSGHYRDGWTLLADGVEVPIDSQIPSANVYTFVNTVPYARRIEVGKTESGRNFVIQVPNLIAQRTASDAKSKFGNIATIKSAFVKLDNAYQLHRDQAKRSFRGGVLRISARQSPDRVAGTAVTSPAVIVTLKAA